MASTTEIRTLLVARDFSLIKHFTSISRDLGIDAQPSGTTDGIPDELDRAKFEAVLLDFDTIPHALPILESVRESRGNHNALVFAVATSSTARQQALRSGANFLLARPLDMVELRRVLVAAYHLMANEHRRYFRCSAELPVLLTCVGSSAALKCMTFNISSNGMAVHTPTPLTPGKEVGIALFLGDSGLVLHGEGTVVWDDKHGKTGLRFECPLPRDQTELETWLDRRFQQNLLPSGNVAGRNKLH